MKILSLIRTLKSVLYAYDSDQWEKRVGALGKDSYLRGPISCANPSLIFVGNHSHIFGQANYIIRNGKFIVGDYTGLLLQVIIFQRKENCLMIVCNWMSKMLLLRMMFASVLL